MGLAQGLSQTSTTNERLAERVGRKNHWTGLSSHTFAQTQGIGTHTTDGRGERYFSTSYRTWLHESHKKHILNQKRGLRMLRMRETRNQRPHPDTLPTL